MGRSKPIRSMIGWVTHCFYCEREFNSSEHHKNCGYKTLDHIIPLVNGGRHIPNNIVIACCWCNNQKQELDLPSFYDKIDKMRCSPKQSVIFKNAGINLDKVCENIAWLSEYIDPHKEALYEYGYKISIKKIHYPHLFKINKGYKNNLQIGKN